MNSSKKKVNASYNFSKMKEGETYVKQNEMCVEIIYKKLSCEQSETFIKESSSLDQEELNKMGAEKRACPNCNKVLTPVSNSETSSFVTWGQLCTDCHIFETYSFAYL